MIATVNLHAHFTIYLTAETARVLISCVVSALTPRERYHKALVVFGITAFVLYIVLLYARMHEPPNVRIKKP